MSENTERRYLKWYNKIGYGSGDVAGNVVYAFLSSFVMIYLTDTVGLNPGIVGTLIAVSKLFDGITDIFFGSMIDKTHSKLGKARPWMLYGYIGCAITLVGIFAIPMGMSEFAKYAWFFICYSLLNAVFYTANNIAYSALTSLVTKNSTERVEMGSYRFMFAFATSLAIQSFTLLAVSALGDTAEAWRTVAIVYAIIGLIVNTLSVFSVKELPEEEFVDTTDKAEIEKDEKYGLVEAAKLLGDNVRAHHHEAPGCERHVHALIDVLSLQRIVAAKLLPARAGKIQSAGKQTANRRLTAGEKLLCAVGIQHARGEDGRARFVHHFNHPAQHIRRKGHIWIANDVVGAFQLGKDKVVRAPIANVAPNRIIMNAGAVPTRGKKRGVSRRIVDHIEVKIHVAVHKALDARKHLHA